MAAIVIRRYRLVFRKRKKFDVLLLRSGFVTPLEPHCEPYSVVDIEQGTREIVLHWKFLWDLLRLLPRHGRNGAVLGAYARFYNVASVVSYDNIQGGWDWASSLRRPMISVQHGMRQLSNDRVALTKPANVIFLSWGELQVEDYAQGRTPLPPNSSHQRIPKKTKPIGSLRDSMYRAIDYRGEARLGRLCLISQFKGLDGHGLTLPTERQRNIDLLIEHLRRYVERRDLELVIALYSDRPEALKQEIEWYRGKFGSRCTFNDPSVEFATYKTTDDCEMSFGVHTSVLWEVFGRSRKMLACNYTGDQVFEFPIDGPWYLKSGTYEEFERRVDDLRAMSSDDYRSLVGDKARYLISYSDELPTHMAIGALISQQVAERD
ncbi:MAG: hypothetical protein EB010_11555 [Acidimicrobiia bacterium]|nr:hypothetical protein [Acidimicrobiia bacterium]